MIGEPLRRPSLRPEQDLLLTCARTRSDEVSRSRIRELTEGELEWAQVLDHAFRHGTVALVHHHLNDAGVFEEGRVPPAVFDVLRRRSLAGLAHTLLLVTELNTLLSRLEEGSAPAVAWKGPVLAYSVYPSPELRTFVDLDILVRRRDVHRARRILQGLGYRARSAALPEEEQFARSDYTVSMVHERTRLIVDVHWGGSVRYFSSAMDTDALCDQAVTLSIAGSDVPALAPAPLLLALCAHGAKHGPFPWPKLKWVSDIDGYLRTYPPQELEQFLDLARNAGGLRMVLLGICLARDLLETPLPLVVERAVRADPMVMGILPGIRDRLLSDQPAEFTLSERVRFDLAIRERSRDRFRYRSQRLLTTNARDSSAVHLPRGLRFLQLPVRLVRLALKVIRRPSEVRALLSGEDAPSPRGRGAELEQPPKPRRATTPR
jgi:hypothetical protein